MMQKKLYLEEAAFKVLWHHWVENRVYDYGARDYGNDDDDDNDDDDEEDDDDKYK